MKIKKKSIKGTFNPFFRYLRDTQQPAHPELPESQAETTDSLINSPNKITILIIIYINL